MPQLGRFDYTVQTALGLAVSGGSVAVYREGATINGNQSGVTPLAVTVRHAGKIVTGDTVFINTVTGIGYLATRTSATVITLSGFGGTLSLTGGDRLTPSGSKPTLYSDDQGGSTTGNPLTTSASGRVSCWMNTGAYDFVVSGGGATTTAFVGQVTVGESPAVVYSGELDSASAVAHVEDTVELISTAGGKLKSFRNLGTEKAAIDKDGTGVFPRIGQLSTATTGGALRIVDGNVFPLTVAGVQAALDECEAVGGGTVVVPAAAGIVVTSTSVKVGNRVRLMGWGAYGSAATFVASASTNVPAMVENKTQDGTQQYAYVEHIAIDGQKATGATVTAGLHLKSIYLGSRLKDVRVTGCSGNGMLIEGGLAAVGLGQMIWDNLSVTACNDHNILITGPVIQIVGNLLGVESAAAGKAQIKITNATAAASFGHVFSGVKFEGTAAYDGLWLDGCSNVTVIGIADHGNSSANNLIKITGTTTGSDGAFGSGGHVFQGILANLTTIIDDQVSGVTVGNAQGRFVQFYVCPKQVQSAGNDLYTGQIVGLQYQRQGIDIAAAATITPGNGNFFVVSGNTNITSVTAAARDKGRIIVLQFSGTPTFTDGSNLKLAGNLVATADDTISLVCDGTNWIEMARSVN